MKLLTKEITKQIPPIYSTDGIEKKKIITKFFTPWSSFTWYVIEGNKINESDWEFFGIVDSGSYKEYGYFNLSQLTEIKGPAGLKVERDLYFNNKYSTDIIN
jgi:hypothetical protein